MRTNEEELKNSQRQLSILMNSMADGLVTFDEAGSIQRFNTAAERIFGHTAAYALEKKFTFLLAEGKRQECEEKINLFTETGQSPIIGKQYETIGIKKNDETFPLETTITWMEIGDEIMFVAMCRDITDRKRAEMEREELENDLRQAQKMESLGTLAGGIAHEINTPVQYLGDNARFLKDAVPDIEKLFSEFKKLAEQTQTQTDIDLDEIEFLMEEMPTAIAQSLEGVERISEIVQAIKEFSHPDTKEKTDIDINHAIHNALTVTKNQWKYVADVATNFDSSLPMVSCLPGELNQVLLNLIVNAAHAIEDGAKDDSRGTITISTKRNDDWLEIDISDTGVGISEENIKKIFDPFYTTKEPGRGTGQGLSISHSIITKKHGGNIAVHSKIGVGTTFTIQLPMAAKTKPQLEDAR